MRAKEEILVHRRENSKISDVRSESEQGFHPLLWKSSSPEQIKVLPMESYIDSKYSNQACGDTIEGITPTKQKSSNNKFRVCIQQKNSNAMRQRMWTQNFPLRKKMMLNDRKTIKLGGPTTFMLEQIAARIEHNWSKTKVSHRPTKQNSVVKLKPNSIAKGFPIWMHPRTFLSSKRKSHQHPLKNSESLNHTEWI